MLLWAAADAAAGDGGCCRQLQVLRYVYRPPQVARGSKVSKDTVGGVLRLLLPLQPTFGPT